MLTERHPSPPPLERPRQVYRDDSDDVELQRPRRKVRARRTIMDDDQTDTGERPPRPHWAQFMTLEKQRYYVTETDWAVMEAEGNYTQHLTKNDAYWTLLGLLRGAEEAARAGVTEWSEGKSYLKLVTQCRWWGAGIN